MGGKRWTEEQENIVRELYPEGGAKACAEFLDRTISSIRDKARRLRIPYTKSRLKTHNQYIEDISKITTNINVRSLGLLKMRERR